MNFYGTSPNSWSYFNTSDGTTSLAYQVEYGSLKATVNELKADLVNKIKDKVKNQDVNLQNALAESGQSVMMIANCATRVAKVLLAMKAGNVLKAVREIFSGGKKSTVTAVGKQLSGDFLAWQYGVKPLLSDLDGACKMLASQSGSQTFVVRTKTMREINSKSTLIR
jgi:hypothetical protein